MDVQQKNPPREFKVGAEPQTTIQDCGSIRLEANQQVTFVTDSKTEYDVARKEWGYYATPSTNGRLRDHKLRTALVMNTAKKLYVMLVEVGKEQAFQDYLDHDQQQVLMWLDSDEAAEQLESIASCEQTHVKS